MTTKEMPLVSIITPTYNQADYLAETIESVLAQDYQNIEYIVLNDGSSDHTEDVLRRYDGRIKWETQPNMGQPKTLNKGWDTAQGKYLGYLSSDDVLHPAAVSELVKALESDSAIVCAYPDSNLIDEKSIVVKERVCRDFHLEDLIICQECYIGPGAIFRSDTYRTVGGWKTSLKLAPDREFWMRLARHGRFYFETKVLAGYRVHRESISYKVVSEEVSREYIEVLDDYFSNEDISEAMRDRKSEAYGRAKFIIARNAFRAGNIARGIAVYREACRDYPSLKKPKYILQLIKNIIGKPLRMAWGKVKGLF